MRRALAMLPLLALLLAGCGQGPVGETGKIFKILP